MCRQLLLLLCLTGLVLGQTLPTGVEKKASVGGVTEYDYPNGLRVLLFPDPAAPKITVDMTYLVGSRHEGYGEAGMAHLLEHMNFIETTNGRRIKNEAVDRTRFFNGYTSADQTYYYETLPATDDNLKWALSLEADRMVNVKLTKEILDTEMTVVRNEFEFRENNNQSVLNDLVVATAYLWHNYGKASIGSREDIELVPIDSLAAFYKKYYQPDNAVLIVSGRIDESKTLQVVTDTVGRIPRPLRKLNQTHTVEPAQDGERFVELRRAGQNKEVRMMYHGPAAAHPDAMALQVLSAIMSGPGPSGGSAQGRLSRALVDTKRADLARMGFVLQHDPGLVRLGVIVGKEEVLDEVRKIMIDVLEGVATNPPSNDEVERVKTRLLRDLENRMGDPETFGAYLSEAIGQGDWRLVFLNQGRLRAVTPEDVVRVAKRYLKPSNRTVGYFVPDSAPDRTVVTEAPGLEDSLKDLKSDTSISRGEAFDPTPANIEARVRRSRLANGMKVVVMDKRTTQDMVSASIQLSWGDNQTLTGRDEAAQLASSLLMRGTRTKTRQQLEEAIEELNAHIAVGVDGLEGGKVAGIIATVQAPAKNFEAALSLAVEILREPSYPEADFNQAKAQRVRELESVLIEPGAMVEDALSRHLSPFAKTDALYRDTREDQLVAIRKLTLDEMKRFHDQFYGASHGVLTVVGPVDHVALQKFAEERLGSWTATGPYQRLFGTYKEAGTINQKIEDPDKASAYFFAAVRFPLSQDDPDYPAMVLANDMIGGTIAARAPNRIRNREGLSYAVWTFFTAPAEGNAAMFSLEATSNPANMPKVEASFLDEIKKTLQGAFTAEEVATAKKTYVESHFVDRSSDSRLVTMLSSREHLGRTFQWDSQMDAKIQSLTAGQIMAALKRHLDPSAISIVKAGDFKAAKAYQ